VNNEVEMIWKEAIMVQFLGTILTCAWREELHSGQNASQTEFDPGTFRIHARSVIASANWVRHSWSMTIQAIKLSYTKKKRVRGSVVGWGTMLQAGRSRVRVPMRWIFFNWPNPSSTMALESTHSNRNEYQESSWGIKSGRRIRLTTLPPSGSRLSR
jgi:hypothetical protein